MGLEELNMCRNLCGQKYGEKRRATICEIRLNDHEDKNEEFLFDSFCVNFGRKIYKTKERIFALLIRAIT